jgi:N-methylhydantoinase A/oxoprolinase/acetone carboxylase beta subunit
MRIGIGIDTGGTYTDAVAFDFETRAVLAKGKARTTKEDLARGICAVLSELSGDLRKQAEFVALSTTLATNACVEGKGGRAKLVLMGTTEQVLRRIGAAKKYGLREGDVLCLDTKGSFDGSVVDMPDWGALIDEHHAWFDEAQAICLCEANAARNGAVVERAGKEALKSRYDVPFVMGCELSSDLNMMARGATALLNGRLLPVVESFLHAAAAALAQAGIDAPMMIVRSDGSLMGSDLAADRPVETILSGPAASVHGSHELASLSNGLIIDMGGTTTDISLVEGGAPVMTSGIRIGDWLTQTKGVFIETFGLGGDSAVRLKDSRLVISPQRVEPISAVAERWPGVVEKLRGLVDSGLRSSRPFNELLYLVHNPSDLTRYSREERHLIKTLQEGPCLLGERDRVDIYTLDCARLEAEGIVMRAGLTPTDIMQVTGDFRRYDTEAAELTIRYVAESMGTGFPRLSQERFCDAVYDLVEFKLYANVVRILLSNRYPKAFGDGMPQGFDEVLREEWKRARRGTGDALFDMNFSTPGRLIGIGAPTHIFLPTVAQALGAECVIPEHAEVANAVGAVVAGVSATRAVEVEPRNTPAGIDGYLVHAEEGTRLFTADELEDAYNDALAFAQREAARQAEAEARRRGAVGELAYEVSSKVSQSYAASGDDIYLGTSVVATASEEEHRGRVR